ncbi:AMP-dependent synthetase [Frankia sp. CcI49]|uniref:alpha/beta fold hydrolase n=1 Tax=Frankia sp. CcI49 TaxID=1745382 RepID=UPI0009754B0B|nr:alpha/beta fold hydrolase [Frankia sp. CcI49]ONH53408.1 AMP-dependent synthetase [Frankia sp. CcI49]
MVGTQPLVIPAAGLEAPYPSIVARFSRIVAARTDVLAICDDATALTYADLDWRSSALARLLVGSGGRMEGVKGVKGVNGVDGVDGVASPVGILLEQGVPATVAMLGVLKAGRPFVPLDPVLPPARLGQILELAGVTTCLTDTRHQGLLAAAGPVQAVLLDPAGAVCEQGAASGPVPAAGDSAADSGAVSEDPLPGWFALPADPAFVVFSSGSTGVPKGVVWRNQTVLHELRAGIDVVGMNATDQVALVLPVAFAAGITVMFWGLLVGATLHALDPRTRGIAALPGWLLDRGISTLHLTPSLIRALTGAAEPGCVLGSLRAVTSSGEAVYGREVAALRAHLPATCTFYNWSGSTETASLAFFPVRSDDEIPTGPLPAGWAVDGKDIDIVDEAGESLPDGASGQMSVTSRYLSGGYWNAAGMTADRFRPARGDLDSGAAGPMVTYRAGDLARRRPDGCIELLGRADTAVKIRGYLVEPAEIEAALLTSPDIVEAVVVARRPADQPPRLVAYVVCAGTVKAAAVMVRGLLREKLPAYMVPASVVLLNELPRNERGKIDRTSLPEPPPRAPGRAPTDRSHWEIAVRDLFAQTLKVDDVGLDDDFVELGGDSLLAQQLLSDISARLGVRLPTSTLAQAPTVEALAARVAAAHRALPTHPTCVPLSTEGSGPPLFCVAGAGGLAINFVALARRLGAGRRVYGFQAQGLENRAFPDWSVERHARRHLEVLRLVQPDGPYHLVGFSFGGLVALEMAHLLTDAGAEVALLALLDSRLPPAARGAGADAAAAADANAPAAGARSGARSPGGAAVGTVPGTRSPDRSPAPWKRLLPSVSKVRKAARLPLTGLVRFSGLSQFDAFFDHARVVSRSYQVRPYAGRTLLYLAEDNNDTARDGWSRHLTGDTTVVTVPGEHHTMLNEPHAAALAADLHARLTPMPT